MENNKEKLYNIFRKVNKQFINEQTSDLDLDDLLDEIKDDIFTWIDNDTFKEGFPYNFKVKIKDKDVEFQTIDDPIELENSNDEELEYSIKYVGQYENYKIQIEVLFSVIVNYQFRDSKFEFFNKIAYSKNDIEVDFIR